MNKRSLFTLIFFLFTVSVIVKSCKKDETRDRCYEVEQEPFQRVN